MTELTALRKTLASKSFPQAAFPFWIRQTKKLMIPRDMSKSTASGAPTAAISIGPYFPDPTAPVQKAAKARAPNEKCFLRKPSGVESATISSIGTNECNHLVDFFKSSSVALLFFTFILILLEFDLCAMGSILLSLCPTGYLCEDLLHCLELLGCWDQ